MAISKFYFEKKEKSWDTIVRKITRDRRETINSIFSRPIYSTLPRITFSFMFDVDVRRKSVVARRKYARRPKVYVSKVSMRIETKVAPRWKSRRRGEGTKGEKKKKRKDSKPRIIHERSLELDTLSTTRVLSRCNKAEWEKIAT